MKMIPTPSTSHVSYSNVYEPAEDSFLLLDTLSSPSESAWLQKQFPQSATSPVIAEIGIGSGVVVAFLVANAKMILGRDDVLALGVDVNPNACAATLETVAKAGTEQGSSAVYLGSICSDLTSPILDKCIDLLIFNPPYVPTLEVPELLNSAAHEEGNRFEGDSYLLSLSYAGGADGMEIIYRLLKTLRTVLSDRGAAYILLCAQNKPDSVKEFVRSTLMMHVETVRSSGKAAGWEKLEVIRLWR